MNLKWRRNVWSWPREITLEKKLIGLMITFVTIKQTVITLDKGSQTYTIFKNVACFDTIAV